MDIAQSFIVKGGYNGFSYADISGVIGIRKASIHHHFPTKNELVAVLVDQYRRQASDGLNGLDKSIPSPLDRLEAYLSFWQKCIKDASAPICVCAMLASEIALLPDDIASRVRAHFQRLAEWLAGVLKSGADQGVFRIANTPGQEAQLFMAAVHGAMLSARALNDPKLFGIITKPLLERLKAVGNERNP
ncbi:TetR/AcrR family transcriptional repressor of nem operon [Rhizobium sp. BK176]|nr:TetR/AcrR family transcriptional repressor of nem operon [Rhizobium sp. BK181]MBB3545523.1 TetR/AcrR family transcriptional repressor of nem operon [Rhizobium sp. BK399]MCS3744383.1 TetR/AcrR family transcriptional repressor of nem operon [Rhizobium sp. BK661]MCS4096697.1 TetR/AcrR family transcriptional repressor of nem operon [Rhizobium sp. BK176]